MEIAVLPNGVSYRIPQSDLSFFKKLAERMNWPVVVTENKSVQTTSNTWVDEFAGKWHDERTTVQIVNDIHAARTSNSEIVL